MKKLISAKQPNLIITRNGFDIIVNQTTYEHLWIDGVKGQIIYMKIYPPTKGRKK